MLPNKRGETRVTRRWKKGKKKDGERRKWREKEEPATQREEYDDRRGTCPLTFLFETKDEEIMLR